MKPFNLQEALAGKPVITRAGLKVTGLCKFTFAKKYPIVATIEGLDEPMFFHLDGAFGTPSYAPLYDLFMQSEKKSGWVNIYHQAGGYSNTGSVIFATQEEAKARMTHAIAQAKIEWEE